MLMTDHDVSRSLKDACGSLKHLTCKLLESVIQRFEFDQNRRNCSYSGRTSSDFFYFNYTKVTRSRPSLS